MFAPGCVKCSVVTATCGARAFVVASASIGPVALRVRAGVLWDGDAALAGARCGGALCVVDMAAPEDTAAPGGSAADDSRALEVRDATDEVDEAEDVGGADDAVDGSDVVGGADDAVDGTDDTGAAGGPSAGAGF